MEKKIEEKYEKENDSNRIVLLILGVATILVALIGATFAYFTAVVNKPNGDQSITVTTTTVDAAIYEASAPILLLNASPGASTESTFSIKNPNASAYINYTLEVVTDYNDFVTTDGVGQLIFTISSGSLSETKVIDMTNGSDTTNKIIATNIPLAPGATNEYNVKVEFVELGVPQNSNQGKTYSGHIDITQSIVTTSGN